MMKATVVVYAALVLLLASAQAQQLLGAGAMVEVDEDGISPRAAAVLDTTRDALSPSDQQLLTDMLQESEGVQLLDEDGESLEDEVEAEADAFVDEAIEDADEEAEDEESESSDEDADESESDSESEEDAEADPYVVAQEIPGTAHSVEIAEGEDEEESEVVEAEDLGEDSDEEEALTDEDLNDIAEEGQAAATGADAEAEDAAFLQVAEAEEDEDEDEAEGEDEETDEEADDSEDEGEDESEEDEQQEEEGEEEQEDETEEEALVESASSSILSVPEAEVHHELMQVQEPALAFLQVVEELDLGSEEDEEFETDAESEISDSADSDDAGEGWGEETSSTDPYALAQTEELLYADNEDGTLVSAPINAVTSTAETAAQIHAELDEAANLDTSSEFMVDTDAALANSNANANAQSDASEAEADSETDTSEEMEVDTYGEGVWQDVHADKDAVKKDANGKLVKPLPDQPSKGWDSFSKDTADTQHADTQTRTWAVVNPKPAAGQSVWGQWNSDLLMP